MQTRENYSGGPNFRAAWARGKTRNIRATMLNVPPDKRSEGRYAQGRTSPALPGHLVSVEAGDDRGSLSRNVYEDRGRRPAVHSPVIDPGQHDDRGHGRHAEGDGKKDRHRPDRTDSGEDSDQGADEDADETVEEVQGLEDDAESGYKFCEKAHGITPCSLMMPSGKRRPR